ncbi:MAG: hypothetical protein JXR97_13420 [Planctomycetes bacterium]|nr:hypothetical protein [Planctomycetota bacterium]
MMAETEGKGPEENPVDKAVEQNSAADAGDDTAGKEIPAEAQQELAKAEALMMGLGGGGAGKVPRKKPGCVAFFYFIAFALLIGFGFFTWYDKPSVYEYKPVSTPKEKRLYVGGRLGLVLPEGWRQVTMAKFSGPDGNSLSVNISSVRVIGMAPKSFNGQIIPNTYTAVAYGNSILSLSGKGTEVLWTRYIQMGNRKGVEACVRSGEGKYIRGVAFVDEKMRAVDMRFTLNGREGSPSWQDATTILTTLDEADPPKPVPHRKGVAEKAEAGE